MATICEICENTEFEYTDGYYYCTVCQTKSTKRQDIQLVDEDYVTGTVRIQETSQQQQNGRQTRQDRQDEAQSQLETAFSTFNVYNYMLRAQCDDLEAIGCSPLIFKVVFELWAKYLQKLKIAFHDGGEINEENIKWYRDVKYMEIYKLKNLTPMPSPARDEQPMNETPTIEIEDEEADLTYQEEQQQVDDADEPQEEVVEMATDEQVEFVEHDEEPNKKKQRRRRPSAASHYKTRILLTRFEWIRMPHTICLLNLALLILKSNILLTDLMRFVHQGKVSYSNANKVLPKSMKFFYNDDATMFNVQKLPTANYLRYLTGKMGQFLELASIELIDIRQISCRYLSDLNLPFEMNALCNALITNLDKHRLQLPKSLDFRRAQNINLEANALVVVLITMIIVFLQTEQQQQDDDEDGQDAGQVKVFSFNNWFAYMQNYLNKIEEYAFGIDIKNVKTIDDLKLLNYEHIDFRYNNETSPFVSQYRQKEILETLALPLNEDQDKPKDNKQHEIKATLLFITDLIETKKKKSGGILRDMRNRRLIVNTSQVGFLVNGSADGVLKEYLKEFILKRQLYFKYKAGLSTSTFHWLMNVFEQLTQSPNIHSILCKYLNKII